MLASVNGNLYCVPPIPELMNWEWWPEWSVQNVVAADEESSFGPVKWRWRLVGFGIGAFTLFRQNFLVILFPYWSLVIPLTLLTAYLLFSPVGRAVAE